MSSFVKYPKGQSYEIVNLMIMILVGAGITTAAQLIVLQVAFQPANQILTEWSISQSQSANSTAQTPVQNATQQLWPTFLTNRDVYNNVMTLTVIGVAIFFATPIVLSLFLSQQDPIRIAPPKHIQYVAHGMLFVTIIAINKFEILPVLAFLALFSPFIGKGQNAITAHIIGYSGTVFDMMGRAVRVNSRLENVLSIFRLDKYRLRLGHISEPRMVEDGVWRAHHTAGNFEYYVEFRRDLSGDNTIISIILYKKQEYAIQIDNHVKEILRMRIAYLKQFMLEDHAIEVVDAPNILAAGLAQYAQNEIKGISAKFERLGYLQIYKNAAFGLMVVAASMYLLSIDKVVEGIGILVPGIGYIIYDLQKNLRE